MWDTGRRDLRRDEIETRSATKLLNLPLNYLLVNLPGTINSTRYFKKVGSYGTRCIVLGCWEARRQALIENTVATAQKFRRSGRFYHSNVFLVFCNGLHLLAGVLVFAYTHLRTPESRFQIFSNQY